MSSTHAVVEMSEIKADLKDAQNADLPKKVDDSAGKTCDITEHVLPHDKLAAFFNSDLEEGLQSSGKIYVIFRVSCTVLSFFLM